VTAEQRLALAVITTAVVDAAGGCQDARAFLRHDDADFCWWATAAGWEADRLAAKIATALAGDPRYPSLDNS
jgi:GT2 family glycosyltransferase